MNHASPTFPRIPGIFWAIFTLLFLILLAGNFQHFRHEQAIQHEIVEEELSALTELRVRHINELLRINVSRIEVFCFNPFNSEAIYRLLRDPAHAPEREHLTTLFHAIIQLQRYVSVALMTATRDVALEVSEQKDPCPYNSTHLCAALQSGKPVIGDFQQDEKTGKICVDIYARVKLPGPLEQPPAAIVFRLDAGTLLLSQLGRSPIEAKSSRTTLFLPTEAGVVRIGVAERGKGGGLELTRLPPDPFWDNLLSSANPSGNGVRMERGDALLCSFRKVPGVPWWLMTETRQRDIYTSVYHDAITNLWMTGGAFFFAIMLLLHGLRRNEAGFLRAQLASHAERQILQQRFEYLSRHASDIILVANQRGDIIEANERACAAYDYAREELLGLKLTELRAAAGSPTAEDVDFFIPETEGMLFETLHRRRNGTIFPVEVSCRSVQTEEGLIYQEIVRDISERKLVEATQTFLLSCGLPETGEGFFTSLARFLNNNLRPARLMIASVAPDMASAHCLAYYENGCAQSAFEYELPSLDSGSSGSPGQLPGLVPARMQRGAQESAWESTTILFGFKGQIIGVIALIGDHAQHDPRRADIMLKLIAPCAAAELERLSADQALRKSEAFFRTLIESLPDLVWLKDTQGVYLTCNRRFESFFGARREEIVGKTDHDFVEHALAEFFCANDQAAIDHGQPTINEEELTFACDGHKELHETIKTPVYGAKGELLGVLGVGRDITRRKHTEQALEQRLLALTQPFDDGAEIDFHDLFSLRHIQELQDQFSSATGVASIITLPDGNPITTPSNYCGLCGDLIRTSTRGLAGCVCANESLGKAAMLNATNGHTLTQPCQHAGILNAGAAITIGGRHIANWIIGQVRAENQSDERVRALAGELGLDANLATMAYQEMPIMSREQFDRVAQALTTLAGQLSAMAFQNVQQARFIAQRRRDQELQETRLELLEFAAHHTVHELLQQFMLAAERLTDSRVGFYHFNVSNHQTLSWQAWPTDDAGCGGAPQRGQHGINVSSFWPDAMRELRPIITNDPASLSRRRGLAENHAMLERELILPVSRGSELVAVIGVGNKPVDYDRQDIATLQMLADGVYETVIRKHAQEEGERLLSAIEQAAEMIVITDVHGSIQYVNPAFEKITGFTREEAIGQTPGILNSGEHPSEFFQTMWWTIAHGQIWKGRIINQRKDGTRLIEEATISPVRNEAGDIVNYVAVKNDVTTQLALEDQYHHAQKMESIGRLAGGIAHDFNNKLGVILGYADMALLSPELDAGLQYNLKEIADAARQSAALTRQLLTFARKQAITPTLLDLNTVIGGMLKMLKRLIGENIGLDWHPGTDLFTVRMDPGQVDQVMANLCVNARDAISERGQIRIETRNVSLEEDGLLAPGRRPGDFVLLSITDDGEGISRENLANIFEPFFTTKQPGLGTGLGLATVYGIIEQNQGWIEVESEPGAGATFNLFIPSHASARLDPLDDPRPQRAPGGHETILLIEDEAPILELCRKMLSQLGYSTFAASSPSQALQLARAHQAEINLLLSDVIMPEMNGHELSRQIKQIIPGLRVLFMSGYTTEAFLEAGIQGDDVSILPKPFNLQDLAFKVRHVLDG